jgi:hypothetical protein
MLSRLGEAERRASEAEKSRDAMVANAAGEGSGDKSLEGQGKAFMEVQKRMSEEMGSFPLPASRKAPTFRVQGLRFGGLNLELRVEG